MPQWAGSSWYFLRYMDPHNDMALASKEALNYWAPVDWYNGGPFSGSALMGTSALPQSRGLFVRLTGQRNRRQEMCIRDRPKAMLDAEEAEKNETE